MPLTGIITKLPVKFFLFDLKVRQVWVPYGFMQAKEWILLFRVKLSTA